jgi:hypothetical protein
MSASSLPRRSLRPSFHIVAAFALHCVVAEQLYPLNVSFAEDGSSGLGREPPV